ISENGLAAGNYTLIVEDADNECSTAQQITQDITISEPAGGALEISLNTITEIPCEGGLGSIQIDISGGSPLTTNSTSSVIDFYTVNVKGGNFFALNTSHDPDDSTLTIGNLSTPGTYVITVTDTNGCQQILSDIILNNSSNGLAATAVITQASGCNELSSTEGGSIQVTWPDRGDGNNAGYPLWQQRKSVNYDSFTIAINGTVAGADLTSSGINITTTNSITIYPSSTASTTFGNIQDLAAQLAYNINQISDLTATLNGSTILVKGEIIDNVTSFNINNPFNISVSGVSQLAQSQWSDIPGMAGMEIISGLDAGYYRAIINDGSGCGGSLVQNTTQGGTIFEIDSPQSLQIDNISFDEITCNQPTSNLQFQISNGSYILSPDPSAFTLSLNSTELDSTVNGTVTFSTGTSTSSTSSSTTNSSTTAATAVGNTYTPNLKTNTIDIESLVPGDYELVVQNIQTGCIAVLNFNINDPVSISYSGETEFTIDSCYKTYQDVFFDQFLIEGGEPYQNNEGESYYNMIWNFYPSDTSQNNSRITTLSNSVNFNALPGTYELMIYDSNGCTILDENGNDSPIEFTFLQQLGLIEINGVGGANGNEFSQPVSCEMNAEDGQINLEVVSSDPAIAVPHMKLYGRFSNLLM
ncbi:hypothetical protein N9C07_08050, partial [Flavobacteriaceae bacterium]|nr:hypothetical protein [Flavobacteriaceae bacterium]